MTAFWHRLGHLATGRRSAWFLLLIGLVVAAGLSGGLSGANPPDSVQSLPTGSESASVQKLQKEFPHHKLAPVNVVITRDHGTRLSKSDVAAADDIGNRLGKQVHRKVSSPIVSKDHQGRLSM